MESMETKSKMDRQIPNKITETMTYSFSDFGKQYVMEYVGERYDGMQIFVCNEPISKYWVNTMGGHRGILSLDNVRETYIMPKVIPIEIHDWAVSKMLDINGMKISNANLAITVKIAHSMMIKKGYSKRSIGVALDQIKEKAIEIIDIKQYEWEQVLESQLNQLPF